jgi:pimeloyl-ACP methyl ester carboxylesterase
VAEVREHEMVVNGLRTRLLEAGSASAGEATVFLHGNPGSAEDWRELVARSGDLGRAAAVDMPGFGRADAPRRFDYRIEGYAEFIEAALAELGIGRVHLVMHDFGGPFGFAWAAANPDRLASAVLFNTGLGTARKWHRFARIWRRPLIGELAMLATTRGRWRQTMNAGEARPLPDEFVDRMYEDYDWATKRAVLKLYRAMPLPYPPVPGWIEQLGRLDRPALIVWGRKDPHLAERRVEELLQAFPSAQVELLEESGHFPFADDPERVAATVLGFLRRQLAADRTEPAASGSAP